jgi:hypothetical protein
MLTYICAREGLTAAGRTYRVGEKVNVGGVKPRALRVLVETRRIVLTDEDGAPVPLAAVPTELTARTAEVATGRKGKR